MRRGPSNLKYYALPTAYPEQWAWVLCMSEGTLPGVKFLFRHVLGQHLRQTLHERPLR